MKTATFCLLALLVLLLPADALAQHADVRPGVAGGRLVTDGYIDDTQETLPGLRVFGYDFQEDPLDPYFAADPGFNALAGSGLPPGSQLLFRVPDAAAFGLPSNLGFWDGTDSDGTAPGTQPSFGLPANAESLRLNLGSSNLAIGTALGSLPGFTLQNVADNGSVHLHLGTFLERAGGAVPTDGIYLFSLALLSSDPQVAESAPLFFVFNNGLSEEEHDVAIGWVQENLVAVPEPSALVLGVLALLAFFALRRPRQS